MKQGQVIIELKRWRLAQGLTMEQAAAMIKIQGKPLTKVSWWAWENGRKVPKPAAMLQIEQLTGLEPNTFYRRPDAGDAANGPVQPSLFEGGNLCPSSPIAA